MQKTKVSKIFSEIWWESGSSRKLIVKEEPQKKQWSLRCQSCYRLRLISHLSSFSKLNMYFCSFCVVFFFIFETISSCLSAVVQSNLCARSELREAVNQLWKLCISRKLWISGWQAVLSSWLQAVRFSQCDCCSYNWISFLNLVKRFNHVKLVITTFIADRNLNSASILYCIHFNLR